MISKSHCYRQVQSKQESKGRGRVSEKLTTVFLVLALVPMAEIRGAVVLCWSCLGHSPVSGSPRCNSALSFSLRDWFTAVPDTAPHCNNSTITTVNTGSLPACLSASLSVSLSLGLSAAMYAVFSSISIGQTVTDRDKAAC
jgi:hypothetical protein